MRSKVGLLVVALVIVSHARVGAAEPPVAVSPGGEAEVVLVGGRCPAFSWGSVEGAREHELVVYAIDESSGDSELDLSAMRKELKVRIPGGASVWTPPLAQCLEPGGSYAWTVRARAGVAWSDWSEVRLFRVDPGPSTSDVEKALETLSRFLAARGDAPALAEPVSRRGTERSAAANSLSKPSADQVINTGNAVDTALKVESAEASAKAFGIHGISGSSGSESAGVVGEASSVAGFGGLFKNNTTGGAGLLAVGGSNSAANIVLGARSCTGPGDDGDIDSDPACPDSDIFLRANDAVVAQIGGNLDSDGNFLVWAYQDTDGVLREVFNVDESGEILVGVGNTSRTRLTRTGLEVNDGGDAGNKTFNIFNGGSGDLTLQVDGVPVVKTGTGTPRIHERSFTTGSGTGIPGGTATFGNVRLDATATNHQVKVCNLTGSTRYFVLSRSPEAILTFEVSGGSCSSSKFIGTDHWFSLTGADAHIVGVGLTDTSATYSVVAITG